MTVKNIYRIHNEEGDKYDGKRPVKEVLGGKGAGLILMTDHNMPVPPAFTLTTDVCKQFEFAPNRDEFMSVVMKDVKDEYKWLETIMGYAPLVSVRSGAPISMPGMMDTILNVGLTDTTLPFWIEQIGEWSAWDSYRRLIQMLGSTGYGIDMGVFDFQMARIKKEQGVKLDQELSIDALKTLVGYYKDAFKQASSFGQDFPQDPIEQLQVAIGAVFGSWQNERAIEYRKQNKIDAAMGTACTVQVMVFGNTGDESGTGVLFTRDPSTGEKVMTGEFLENAQGEDVVAGIRTPHNIHDMGKFKSNVWDGVYSDLIVVCQRLEELYNDMVDLEFTVQDGKLYILQSRTGKRSARAAFQIAVDLVQEGVIDIPTALKRITPEQYKVVRRPNIKAGFDAEPNAVGLPACPGIAVGRPVYSSAEAVKATDPVILVTHETDPDDIAGMGKAVGILTQTGGATSHAAVVARAMDKPCVVGTTDLDIQKMQSLNVHQVTIDGATGRVWFGINVPVEDASADPAIATVVMWCLEELKAAQLSPTDLDADVPTRIMAAYWWNDLEVADAVIKGLEALPTRSQIVLDLTMPKSLVPKSDEILVNAFVTDKEEAFLDEVLERLTKSKKLKGLQVVSPERRAILVQHGFTVSGKATTVADLLNPGAEVTDEFIKKVFGTQEAFNLVTEALKGKIALGAAAIRQGLPPEYAAFTRLGR